MKYLSVCSGIEAASVAWKDLDWDPIGFSEIEPFPCAVLQHHYPNVQNFGSMLEFDNWDIDKFDLLVGGTPCQSFSVNGLRKGLQDERGNLALTYCLILAKWRPRWFVWENVPGVLTSTGGRDFLCLTSAMAELGHGFCYRVLDARYFGVPQNRRRVFVIGYLGDWRPPAEVLFEPESVHGFLEQNGKSPAGQTESADRHDESSTSGTRLFRMLKFHYFQCDGRASTIAARDYKSPRDVVLQNGKLRRLTPLEFERLQGFPDNYTNVPYDQWSIENLPLKCRYKALGNSMAIPVMKWIGKRIDFVNYKLVL